MRIETSWDDARLPDLRLVALLRKHRLPAVFYIPSNCELEENDIRDLAETFEIGGHTVNHPQDLKLLSDEQLDYEIGENKRWLEELIGHPITKFCYPRGRYDDRVVEAVKRAGFTEARTVTIGCTTLPDDPFRRGTSVHTYNRQEYNGLPWPEYARQKFQEAKIGGYFHLWGHSWEFEKYDGWEELEKLFEYINENLDA